MRASWLEYQPRRHKKRLAAALAVSLLVHGLMLSLRFGIPGLGLPGIAMPWAERRARSTDLIVHLVEAPVAPPSAPLEMERGVPSAREPYPNTLELRPVPKDRPRARRGEAHRAVEKPKPAEPLPAKQQPEILAVPEHEDNAFSVPAPAVAEEQRTPDTSVQEEAARIEREAARLEEAKRQEQAEAARPAQELEEQRQAEKAARELALARQKQEEKRQEEAGIQEQAKKKEQERVQRLALEIEARRQAEQALALAREKEDQEREAIRQEKEKAVRLAQQLEARRQAEESARQAAENAARQKELEARKAEELAARQRAEELAERQRAEALARQREAERAAAPPAASARELASRALEQLRSPGVPRTQRPGARPSLEGSDSSPRRSILGSVRGDIGLQMYIESWRAKIERNGNLNYPPSARNRAHEQPIVTVAIRRDGTVEDVLFHQSSGMRDLDEAVRNIVRLYAPFSTFPPDLARRYDVIEIRRVWFFGDTLRILEEMR